MHHSRFLALGAAVLWGAIALAAPLAAAAGPCAGTKRLQLRWSPKTQSALVSLSATLCDRPPACTGASASPEGTLLTKSPITVVIKDAAGHSLSGVVNPADANCAGRCERSNRGGCPNGADTHRRSGSFIRYVFGNQGHTSVVVSKLTMPAAQQPNFTGPITVIVTDANGYAVSADLRSCRVRQSANGAAISCS
jgi:hypothetical protein